MATYKIKEVYIVNGKRRKVRNGTVESKKVPKDKQTAIQWILEYVESTLGGEIDIENGTVTTHLPIGGCFSCTSDLGCAGKFVKVRAKK